MARITAFGVVQALRERLDLPADASEQDVLDAVLTALPGGDDEGEEGEEGEGRTRRKHRGR